MELRKVEKSNFLKKRKEKERKGFDRWQKKQTTDYAGVEITDM